MTQLATQPTEIVLNVVDFEALTRRVGVPHRWLLLPGDPVHALGTIRCIDKAERMEQVAVCSEIRIKHVSRVTDEEARDAGYSGAASAALAMSRKDRGQDIFQVVTLLYLSLT